MRNKSLSIKLIVVIAIIAISIGIVIGNIAKNSLIKKEITQEYIKIMDSKMEEYLNSNELDSSRYVTKKFFDKIGLEKIEYEVTNIFKENDLYILEIEIYLTCNSDSEENNKELLAYDVLREFLGIEDDYFIIGDYKCSYTSRKDLDYMFEEMITVYLNGEKVISPNKHLDKNDDEKKIVCRRSGCGKAPVYTDWERRYCSEHIQETHYCRYPECTNSISNSSTNQYCYEHD